MQITPTDTSSTSGLAMVARAHESLNAAYNSIAVDRTPASLVRDVDLARAYVHEARAELTTGPAHGGLDAARGAARNVLPRLDHALRLLEVLETTRDEQHVRPLLDELGAAMDHVEQVLAGAGWD